MVLFKTVHSLTYDGFCLREQYLKQASRLIEKLCHKAGFTISVCLYLSSEFCHETKFLMTLCKSTFHKKGTFSTVQYQVDLHQWYVSRTVVSTLYCVRTISGFSHKCKIIAVSQFSRLSIYVKLYHICIISEGEKLLEVTEFFTLLSSETLM